MIEDLTEVLNLVHPDRRFALRLLDCGQDGTVAGIFDDPRIAAEAVARYDGVASACYVHLHELKPKVAVMNRLKPNVVKAISGKQIDRYRWLLVDLDPERRDPLTDDVLIEVDDQGSPVLDGRGQPKRLKCPSTAAELANALDRRDQVVDFLTDLGFPAPLTGMSGNGGHALFALDLPNDEETKRTVAQVLQTLDLLFTGAGVDVDTSVFDPARIVKLYGTIAKKGREFDDRPFRRSFLDAPPPAVETAPLALLKSLVAEYQAESTVVDVKPQEAAQKPQEVPRRVEGDQDGKEVFWYDLDELKDRVDIVEVARRLGLDPKEEGSNWIAYCPAHLDHRTGRPNLVIRPEVSFAEGEGRAKCYRCDFRGDVIDLVEEAKGLKTGAAIRWLADLAGLQPTIKPPRSRDLGNNKKGKGAKSFPNLDEAVAPVGPPEPPDQRIDLGNDAQVMPPDSFPNLAEPVTLTFPTDAPVATVAGQWERLDDGRIQAQYAPALLAFLTEAALLPQEAPGEAKSRSPRVRVFEALLGSSTPAADYDRVAAWLKANWGLTPETLTRFGVVWLDDPAEVGRQLVETFGAETLRDLRLLTKSGDLVFARHKLLFPFWVSTDEGRFPVFAQGRDPQAKRKEDRFFDPGPPPVPYNVDAITEARRRGQPVFLCEGLTDTLTLAQSGRLAVGIPGSRAFVPDWVDLFDGLTVYLAFDGDEAGRRAAQVVAAHFTDKGFPSPLVVDLPDGEDVTSFFLKTAAVVTPPFFY